MAMTKRELFHHVELLKQMAEDQETLAAMRAAAYPKARRLDGMPHATGFRDHVGDLAAEIADMETQIQELQRELLRSEARLTAWIGGIDDSRTRMIFRLRFLHGMDWKTVAKTMGRWDTKDAVKQMCYRYIAAHLEP